MVTSLVQNILTLRIKIICQIKEIGQQAIEYYIINIKHNWFQFNHEIIMQIVMTSWVNTISFKMLKIFKIHSI